MPILRGSTLSGFLVAGLVSLPALGQAPVIIRGKVQMQDGSAPGKSVGTEKICSDRAGSGPGPLTDKTGKFTWTMTVDYMQSKRCYIRATLDGYQSTEVEISNINPAVGVNIDLPPIILQLKGSDPYQLTGAIDAVPGKASKSFKAALDALSTQNLAEAASQMKMAAEAAPKYAPSWHNLGILYEAQNNLPEARKAYEQAIVADPKMLAPYVTLTHVAIKQKDWETVKKTYATLIPLDKKRLFPEMYVHQAVALYNLKDLAGAEAAAKEALNPKEKQIAVRGEYVLGRILEAKGDIEGAKQHMNRYMELQPNAEDIAQIKAHVDMIGQQGAPEPDLEILR